MKLPVTLTIAGSDSGGGAGIQADLKTFAALGCHGTSAVTAITAQNTLGVNAVAETTPEMVLAQIDAIFADLRPGATKTGMLSSSALIDAVAAAVRAHQVDRLVVDPVMVAKGGARLLREDAVGALRERLLPLATIVTPNLPEAEVLLGRTVASRADREQAARDLVGLGCQAAVVKGGHAEGDADDVLFDGQVLIWFPGKRLPTANTHGSGCVFSAAIAVGLARSLDLQGAVAAAKEFVTGAIRWSLELGTGHGPVNPMWAHEDKANWDKAGFPR